MIKRYRLIKDLPEFKIGDIFEAGNSGGLWTLDKSDERRGWMMVFRQKTLDKYPNIMKEWFEPIEEAKADPIFDDTIAFIVCMVCLYGFLIVKEICERKKK